MNQNFNEKSFKKLINFTYGITKVILYMSFVFGILSLVAFLVLSFIPGSIFDNSSLTNFRFEIGNTLSYVFHYQLSNGSDLKAIALGEISTGFTYLAFVTIFCYYLKNILTEVKNQNPFSEKSIKNIFKIGHIVILGGIIAPIVEFCAASIVMNTLNLNDIDVTLSLDTNLIFIGLLVLVLANIFKYGAHLQNEYDQTV